MSERTEINRQLSENARSSDACVTAARGLRSRIIAAVQGETLETLALLDAAALGALCAELQLVAQRARELNRERGELQAQLINARA